MIFFGNRERFLTGNLVCHIDKAVIHTRNPLCRRVQRRKVQVCRGGRIELLLKRQDRRASAGRTTCDDKIFTVNADRKLVGCLERATDGRRVDLRDRAHTCNTTCQRGIVGARNISSLVRDDHKAVYSRTRPSKGLDRDHRAECRGCVIRYGRVRNNLCRDGRCGC